MLLHDTGNGMILLAVIAPGALCRTAVQNQHVLAPDHFKAAKIV